MKKITLSILCLLSAALSFAQFSEDFNGTTFPPTGWVEYAGANGLGPGFSWVAQDDALGQYAFCRWEAVTPATADAEDWLVSPLIAVSATQNLLTFDATDFNDGDFGSELAIRISATSQTDITSFTEELVLDEAALGNNPNTAVAFTNYQLDISSYIGQSVYIAFVHVQNDGDAISIDNVILTTAPVCAPAANLTFDAFTASTADISWDNTGTYSIEFGEFPYTQGGMGTTTIVTGDNYQLTSLTPGVAYDVYVTQDCGVDGTSSTETVLVGTSPDLVNATFPFNEDFEVNPNQALLLNLGVSFFTTTNNWDYGQDNLADGDYN